MTTTKCKSYRERQSVCADGFVQRTYCRGQVGCFHCGAISTRYLPACLSDDVPEHMVNSDGTPLFYRGAAA